MSVCMGYEYPKETNKSNKEKHTGKRPGSRIKGGKRGPILVQERRLYGVTPGVPHSTLIAACDTNGSHPLTVHATGNAWTGSRDRQRHHMPPPKKGTPVTCKKEKPAKERKNL